MLKYLKKVNKFSEAFISCYEIDKYSDILSQIEFLEELMFGEGNDDIGEAFTSRESDCDIKHQIIDNLSTNLDEFLSNALHILVDRNLIYYVKIFFTSVKSKLMKGLDIQNIYVYSSYEIDKDQKDRLETVLKNKVKSKTHNFIYGIDKSLKLGIKVQVDSFIDEFSVASNLLKMKLKFDSIVL